MSNHEPSPRIPDAVIKRVATSAAVAHPHTDAELERVLDLVGAASTVTLGHGRHPASWAAVQAFALAWERPGRTVLDTVTWPAQAASWRRAAQRLIGGDPDVLVVADTPSGWAQVARRLSVDHGWDPTRVVGFAGVGHVELVELLGPRTMVGMTGATASGDTWTLGSGLLFVRSARSNP
ncbi:hypothetical protein RHODO2019_18395 (plasmid) [Rhodococcus antarcticus]|uniref:Uncharacterized protein n=1 Tax=Rhodococcus antarcticus TaxID=2987751 RepID=A0ABY6P5C6_9NOCA|nr:hypothetical protein [Rhodococcus antarcticus]UZJ26852.1 hypothetical protein RHODO2019_18395 [Rhodococcus antarcticus]